MLEQRDLALTVEQSQLDMKFLDYPVLDRLSKALTFESAECKVFTQLEAYSCKTVSKEKRLLKSLESQYMQSASMSPPDYLDETLASPFGRLDQAGARKVLFLLIATLNGAFPHHDFSVVSPSDFRRQPSSASVLNSLSTTLLSLRHNSNTPRSFSSFPSSHEETFDGTRSSRMGNIFDGGFDRTGNSTISHPELATVLDDIMDIKECEVYSFHPDAESDPHACADDEEEADDYDDDRYDDGGLSSDDDDDEMRHRHSGSHDIDAPMFDEDYLSGGFQGDSNPASQPATPRTPTSTRARAGDYFSSSQRKRQQSQQQHQQPQMSMSLSSSDSYDDDDVPSGLLWANYTFFYNRRMKRILFVSVWSRRNSGSAPHYGFSPPSYPTTAFMPQHQGSHTRSTTVSTNTTVIDDPADDMTPGPSPAKRAIARASTGGAGSARAPVAHAGGRGGHRHGRSASGSPAPSSLSPFPHASPQAPGRRGPSNLGAVPTIGNLDGTLLSASAPAVQQQPLAVPSASSSLARQTADAASSLASSSSASSSTKRTGEMARPEDESRKHRRVNRSSMAA